MLFLYFLVCTAVGTAAQSTVDGCPKDEIACLDIINSSQCLEQVVLEKQSPVTKEALIKCVEYNGTASHLPGATKVSWPLPEIDLTEQRVALPLRWLPHCADQRCYPEVVPNSMHIIRGGF